MPSNETVSSRADLDDKAKRLQRYYRLYLDYGHDADSAMQKAQKAAEARSVQIIPPACAR